jgi:hypothetical protein
MYQAANGKVCIAGKNGNVALSDRQLKIIGNLEDLKRKIECFNQEQFLKFYPKFNETKPAREGNPVEEW